MSRRSFAAVTGTILVLATATGCTGQSPTQPADIGNLQIAGPSSASSSWSRLSGSGLAGSPYGGHAVPLIGMPGSVPAGGGGILNDTQTGEPGFNNFEVTVNVHGGPSDTDLYFQFVGDVLPPTRGDGVCPAPFPAPPANTIAVIRTSAGGSGRAHVKFEVPEGAFAGAFDSGVKADFKWRIVDLAQTFDLQTPCIVLTGK